MKRFIKNFSYFIKEAGTVFRMGLISNLLSLISIGLILFILALVITGWWVSSQVVGVIEAEAEISVYYDAELGYEGAILLLNEIKEMSGIRDARIVDEEEAYERMAEVLGKEARVMEHFEANPFNAFIEARIDLEQTSIVIEQLENNPRVDFLRDNRSVLDRLKGISSMLRIIGYLLIIAAGITTLVIVSHIIRQGIYSNKEHIQTLKLLGAPDVFIDLPYFIEGLLLNISGGLMASLMIAVLLLRGYSSISAPMPFIPLPPLDEMLVGLISFTMGFCIITGMIGSYFGLVSAKKS